MRSDLRSRVRLLTQVCFGILIAVSACGCVWNPPVESTVPASLTREERFKISADAATKFHCERQWNALWPLAREGDGEALLHLAYGFSMGRLQLPDSDDAHPMAKQSANGRAMAIYAAAAPAYSSKDHLRLFLGATTDVHVFVVDLHSSGIGYRPIQAFPAASTKKLGDCFSEASSPEASNRCADLAAELGYAPKFSEYRKAVDDLLTRNLPRPCYSHH